MKKIKISTIVLILIFLVGLSLLLYPTVSDYWNSLHQSQAIVEYSRRVEEMDGELYEKLWNEAIEYNRVLADRSDRFEMTRADRQEYESLLNVSGNGIMGYIEVPAINCSLPIYHGTNEAVLQTSIGHLEGSSLPTGGAGTHCVVSGHRGLPSARLFTDLDKLTEGDIFILKVLDQTLTYEVDQILTVDPYDLSALAIDPQQDYCTLVTCTPYGINTHRLLVRGHRVENRTQTQDITEARDISQVNPVLILSLAAGVIIILIIILLVRARRKNRRNIE
ncbi:MAG TPA: class C sortase [Candidatus Pullilachnospira stercoravium]|mgnify:FL=1|uniref:Class C sortase n=1 Tax=Candidatus Pullilachnospira stercoravium TaxID=2840913 RepID=A0A9D1NSV6_9FIRM|nr:class C sortase [Candidatus Pullilachnospira stercoravium]